MVRVFSVLLVSFWVLGDWWIELLSYRYSIGKVDRYSHTRENSLHATDHRHRQHRDVPFVRFSFYMKRMNIYITTIVNQQSYTFLLQLERYNNGQHSYEWSCVDRIIDGTGTTPLACTTTVTTILSDHWIENVQFLDPTKRIIHTHEWYQTNYVVYVRIGRWMCVCVCVFRMV